MHEFRVKSLNRCLCSSSKNGHKITTWGKRVPPILLMLSTRFIVLLASDCSRWLISSPFIWLNLEQVVHCQKKTSSCGTCALAGMNSTGSVWWADNSKLFITRGLTGSSSCDDISLSSGTLESMAFSVSWVCVCLSACLDCLKFATLVSALREWDGCEKILTHLECQVP